MDFALDQPTFKSLANKKVANFGKQFNWTADFGNLDLHLEDAKEHATLWNTEVRFYLRDHNLVLLLQLQVYPAMRSLFLDVDKFSQKYIASYSEIEPNLKALKRQRVD